MSFKPSSKKASKNTRPILNFFQNLISNNKINKTDVRITTQGNQTEIFVKDKNIQKDDLCARVHLLVYDKFTKVTKGIFKRAKKGSQKFDVSIQPQDGGIKIKEKRVKK